TAPAGGMPGEPPPEPTSTIGPSSSRTSSTARSASSSSIARAAAGSRIAVRPGVSTTASSQPRSASLNPVRSRLRQDDDVAVRLQPLGGGLHALELLDLQVHDLPLDRGHRVELHARAGRTHLFRCP